MARLKLLMSLSLRRQAPAHMWTALSTHTAETCERHVHVEAGRPKAKTTSSPLVRRSGAARAPPGGPAGPTCYNAPRARLARRPGRARLPWTPKCAESERLRRRKVLGGEKRRRDEEIRVINGGCVRFAPSG